MAAMRDEKGRFIKGVVTNPRGRPPKEREARYLDIMLTTVTPDDWAKIIIRAAEQAKRGDAPARKWLSDYLLGPPVQRQEISGPDGDDLRIQTVTDAIKRIYDADVD